MEQKILDEIKDKYNTKLKILKKYEVLTKRIGELEENEFVKEYMELITILKNHEGKDMKTWNDNKLIESAFRNCICNIQETNGIYVYIGTYMSSHECDIVHGSSDIRLNRDDPKAEYRIYKNIETSDSEMVSVKQWDEFEKTHKIIYPKTTLTDSFFYAAQNEFFSIAIKESQETACNKILSEECHKNILYMIHN